MIDKIIKRRSTKIVAMVMGCIAAVVCGTILGKLNNAKAKEQELVWSDKMGYVLFIGYMPERDDLVMQPEIDMDIAVEHCCADCLNILIEEYYSVEPYDVVVLNYKTGEIRLLASDLRSFMMGDFYVTCEPRCFKGEKEISEMDLFIVYCPERYE